MSDEEDHPLIHRVVGGTQRRLGKLRRPAAWVRKKVNSALLPRLEHQTERLMLAIAEPENAQRVQTTLARVAQLGMELGFRADPDAGQLYELVSWLEERHGREPVVLRVVAHAADAGSGFRRTLESRLFGLTQPPGSEAQQEAARQMHEVRDEIAADLLGLLCSLAALEADEEPPSTIEAQLTFFVEAGLPVEFHRLPARAVNSPGAFDQPGKSGDEDASQTSGIARFVPSFDDPHLRFLTLSQLFFVHSYLTRNLIERLPELLAATQQFEA